MFAQLRGTLLSIDTSTALIDVQGIGFQVGMPTLDLAALGPVGSEQIIYTTLIVRADALELYGFIDLAERELFNRLLQVSGVGPKLALSALSSFSAGALQQLIIDEDVKRLTTISGLGKKTAQRLILELRGTLVAADEGFAANLNSRSSVDAEVNEALLGMGFSKAEIELASRGYDGPADNPSEQILYALKRLGGHQ